jgi:hypothetical protein
LPSQSRTWSNNKPAEASRSSASTSSASAAARFDHRLGQLFQEQRHAVGGRYDLIDDVVRQCLVARSPAAPDRGSIRFRRDPVEKGGCDPGLADVRFAADQHHLTFATLGAQPASQQQIGFLLATDERCKPRPCKALNCLSTELGLS